MASYGAYDWTPGLVAAFRVDGVVGKALSSSVAAAMRVRRDWETFPGNGGHKPYCNEYGPIIPYAKKYTEHHAVGEAMAEWLKANKDVGEGFHTNDIPQYLTSKTHGGCVRAGTRILVAPGCEVPVESIEKGTPVVAAGGSVSRASGELVRNGAVDAFYVINGDAPFLSLEHPILTQDGFKCLDPDGARMIDPTVEVSLLQVGDLVNRVEVDEGGRVAYRLEEVRSIEVETVAQGSEMSYDLHFADGYKSCHANGYVCLLNYPAMTLSQVEDRLSYAFNRADRRRILQRLANDRELRCAVGETTASLIESMVASPVLPLEAARDELLERDDVELSFSRIVFDDEPDGGGRAVGRLAAACEAVESGMAGRCFSKAPCARKSWPAPLRALLFSRANATVASGPFAPGGGDRPDPYRAGRVHRSKWGAQLRAHASLLPTHGRQRGWPRAICPLIAAAARWDAGSMGRKVRRGACAFASICTCPWWAPMCWAQARRCFPTRCTWCSMRSYNAPTRMRPLVMSGALSPSASARCRRECRRERARH